MSTPTGYTSAYTASQIDSSIGKVLQTIPEGYAMVLALTMMSAVSTTTQITSPEWKFVMTDHDDKILLGIKQDDSIYIYATIGQIMDCINDSYST